jgi:hypothetical protein
MNEGRKRARGDKNAKKENKIEERCESQMYVQAGIEEKEFG